MMNNVSLMQTLASTYVQIFITEQRCRYTPFNVDALEKIACQSIGAQSCLSWEKIGEGIVLMLTSHSYRLAF